MKEMDEMKEKMADFLRATGCLAYCDCDECREREKAVLSQIFFLETDTCRIAVVRKNPIYTSDLELDIENWVQEVKDAQ